MTAVVRRMTVCFLFCVVMSGLASSVAFGESVSQPSSTSLSSEGALVVPGVQSLDEGQQAQAQAQASLTNPEAVSERETSATKFKGLNTEQATKLASEDFPGVMDHPAGPPQLATGVKSLGFTAANVEQVQTATGDVGVVQSSVPMAVASGGHWASVNLALREANGGFEAQNPLLPVRLPKHLAEGGQVAGVSLTPADEHGTPLDGSQVVANGTSVFFANTQTDADAVFRLSSTGLDASTVLRSISSPEVLYYRVGMPQGASLVASSDGLGAEVLDEGVVIGRIKPPTATDAAGTAVPASMSVSGDTLVVTVKHHEGSWRYPILTDPELSGYWQEWSNVVPGDWEFHEWSGYKYEIAGSELRMKHEPGSFQANDYATWNEKTKGYTKIFEVYVKDELYPSSPGSGGRDTPGWLNSYIETYKPGGGREEKLELTGSPYRSEATVCGTAGCAAAGADAEGNAFLFTLTTNEAGSTGEQFYAHAEQVSTGIAQEHGKHSTVSYNTTSPEIEGNPNALAAGGQWIGPHSGELEYYSEDGGLGVSESWTEVNGSGGWGKVQETNFLTSSLCAGIQCNAKEREVASYNSLTAHGAKPLLEPEAHIRVSAKSYMPYSSSNEHGEGEAILKVDTKPPRGIVLTGLNSKGKESKELELGEVEAHFKVEATDGEGGASSGVKSIGVEVDGHEIGKPGGYCAPGTCAGSTEWAVNGAELGTGVHVLKVVATDNVGNIEPKEYELKVYHASPVALGPGSVNPESGDFALEATDVHLSGGTGSLQVTRHYDSRNLKEGEEGPLGPQWAIGLGSLASLEVLPDGSVMVIGPKGLTHFSIKKGGGFEAPEGDKNLTLEYESKAPAYLFKNPAQGAITEFTLPKGAKSWMPTVSRGPVTANAVTDEYTSVTEGVKTIIEPTLELAPHAAATCAKEKMEAGCRALEFRYGKETTAKGESKSEWGEYKNRLREVLAVAYNPSTKKVTTTAVAQYEYDLQGRLRAEWDPRISPALKTLYGYDTEGHVTALTPPGQESWAFTYGTTPGDYSTGRLLKVMRAPASTKAWTGEAPKISTLPILTGSPLIGVRMGISNGTWANEPITYVYQWEDCYVIHSCAPIPGATNANYTPVRSDVGYKLVARVAAINGGGATSVISAESGKVLASQAPTYSTSFGSYGTGTGQFTFPNAVAIDSKGDIWVGDSGSSRVDEFNEKGEYLKTFGSNGKGNSQFECVGGIAVSPKNNVFITDCTLNRVQEFNEKGEYITQWGSRGSGNGQFYYATGVTADSKGDIWVVDHSQARVEEFNEKGEYLFQFSTLGGESTSYPQGVGADSKGNIWTSDEWCSCLKEFNSSGVYLRHSSPVNEGGGGGGVGLLAVDGSNNIWVANVSGGRAVEFNETGEYISVFGTEGSGSGELKHPEGLAVDSKKDVLVADSLNARIEKWIPATSTEGEHYPVTAGATVEYNVALEGEGAPQQMGSNPETHKPEPERWGQSDDPTYGTAIFPPDEPQSWPSTGYQRATVYYMDNDARTVNLASPSGGISTTEYNVNNDVVRTLSSDNRAAALKEGSKSAEDAKKLDSESKYNGETEKEVTEPGTRLIETIGPEHKVKLSSGTEVSARPRTLYSYDEGAPQRETFDLVTKTQVSALYEGKEADVRETRTSYSGQKGLGWKLRIPTSVTTDPAGLDLTKTTVYDENSKEESTGSVVETKAPSGSSEAVYPPVASSVFGSLGSGNGQLKQPWAVALDSSENVWALDTGNNRVEKFSSSGSFIGAYGKEGTGTTEFKEPVGITVNQSTHNVYVADKENNRIEELSSSGVFLETIGWGVSDGKAELEVCKASCKAGISGSGNGQFNSPAGVAVDSHGDLLIADRGNNRIETISEAGSYISQFGSKGSGSGQFSEPTGVVISEGSLYVVDKGNDRIEQFSLSGSYIGQFGSKGSGSGQLEKPICITANPSTGTLYVCDYGNERMEEFSPAGKFLTEWGTWGSKHPQSFPAGAAVGATGKLYIIDPWANEVGTWIPPEAGAPNLNYSTQFGSKGTGNGQFTEPADSAIDGKGNLWSTDTANNRIEELSSQGSFIAAYGKTGVGEAQFSDPTGIAINKSTGNAYIADTGNNRIEELSSTGAYIASFGTSGSGTLKAPTGVAIDTAGDLWAADRGNNRIVEFSSTGTYIAAYGKEGTGEAQFKSPVALAFSGENIYVADSANHRVEELTNKGAYVRTIGFEGNGSGEFWTPEGITADAAGNLYVVDNNADHVEEFSPNGSYKATFAAPGTNEGQLTHPSGDSISPAGDLYITDTGNNRIQKWANNNQAVHDTQTIYYTPKTEATVPACQNHPEWAGLPCQTQPAGQPETSGLPNLPVTDITYNMWDQAETITETFGSTTRTRKNTFDTAGRSLTSEETSTVDKAFPKVTDEYNKETGALEKESTTVEGKTKTITKVINARGQLTSYTDADGATTKYTYDVDGRTEEVNDSKGYQIYAYDPATGFLTKLLDSAAGTFTASYDVEGKMLTESYPNGMNANYIVSPAGQDTKVEYVKTTHCTTGCTWFSDAVVPSIHGGILAQTSTLSSEAYTYDNAGRLLQTQETPAGKGCFTRIYAYDEESNRRSLTTREPGVKGECVTEGGNVERHIYDPANRLIDNGTSYENFGNTTNLPASDAGGGNGLTSSYYVDSQVASQTQNGETINYNYDPAGRTRETISSGKTAATITTHYDGLGNALSWTSENTEHWTRNIPGISGEVAAIQTNAGTPVLQLHDLNGNIIATAALSETETKLLSTYNSTEFGVPTTSNPPKYSWLGADGIASELPSGDITQDGSTYIPLTGQPLQTEPIELPLPPKRNEGTFEKPNAEGATLDPISSALAVSEATAARQAAGSACNIETEGCAADPEQGTNLYKCKVKSSWVGEAEITANISCGLQFQVAVMQIEIWRVENGGYVKVFLGMKRFYNSKYGEWSPEPSGGCEPGKWYRGWVYASVWLNGQFVWSASGVNSNNSRCYEQGASIEDPIEGEPGGAHSGEDGGGGEE